MGYSLGVHARSKALQKKMLDFMEKEYRPHWQVRGLKEMGCYSGEPTDDPSYCHGKTIIGIDFNASGWERGYAFTLIHWMALQVGRTRSSFQEPKVKFRTPVPCMTYDGDSPWPLLVKPLNKVPQKLQWCCIDKYGMTIDPQSAENYVFDLGDVDLYRRTSDEVAARNKVVLSNRTPEEREIWWKLRREVNEVLWPKVQKVLEPMRTEMKRLDAAWHALG